MKSRVGYRSLFFLCARITDKVFGKRCNSRAINPLEERRVTRLERGNLIERLRRLNNDARVDNDVPLRRRGVVLRIRVAGGHAGRDDDVVIALLELMMRVVGGLDRTVEEAVGVGI